MPRLLALLALFVAAPALGQSVLLQTLTSPEPVEDDNFGRAVALGGDFVVVGEPGDEGAAGHAYVYLRAPGTDTWALDAELEPSSLVSTSGTDPNFGAAAALSGWNALIGAPFESETEPVSGAAYIFRRDEETSNWIDFAKFKAPTPATGDAFGAAVALSGGAAAVGAYGDDEGENAGAVYTYTENVESGAWTFAQRLVPEDPAPGERFGYVVALSGDLLVVGTSSETTPGAAYVFERESADSPWTQVQRLVADVANPGDRFGAAVATDGSTVFVGAPFAGPTDEGAAFVYERTGTGETPWEQAQRLVSNAPQSEALFGASMSVEGDRAVIGAPLDGTVVQSGAVYPFERVEGGPWNPTGRLTPDEPMAGALFGSAVAFSGPLTLVGAPNTGAEAPGAAFVFSLLPTATEGGTTPSALALEAPFPNPVRTATTVAYTLSAPSDISLVAYDVLGREVDVLERGVRPAGRHTVRWAAPGLPSGVYVVRLASGERTATRRLIVLR